MSFAQEQPFANLDPIRHPTRVGEADVIEIGTLTNSQIRSAHSVNRQDETVILGRAAPRPTAAAHPAGRTGGIVGPDAGPIVDRGDLHNLMINRRERYYSAPPPPRIEHRGWMLSSLVIAGGGVSAVLAASDRSDVPLVAMIALISTVLCGALLIAAQVTEEVRRARHPSRAWPRAWQP